MHRAWQPETTGHSLVACLNASALLASGLSVFRRCFRLLEGSFQSVAGCRHMSVVVFVSISVGR